MKMVIRFSYFSICAYLMMAHVIVGYAEDMTVANISAKQMNVVKQSKAVEQTVIIEPEKATEHTKSIKPPQTLADNTTHIDVKALKKRLRTTQAIGFFTKLAIRNDIVDLTDRIKRYRKQSKLTAKLNSIRASFDGLLLKIVALLDEDPDLSRDLYVGREQIWQSLLEGKT